MFVYCKCPTVCELHNILYVNWILSHSILRTMPAQERIPSNFCDCHFRNNIFVHHSIKLQKKSILQNNAGEEVMASTQLFCQLLPIFCHLIKCLLILCKWRFLLNYCGNICSYQSLQADILMLVHCKSLFQGSRLDQ